MGAIRRCLRFGPRLMLHAPYVLLTLDCRDKPGNDDNIVISMG